MTAFNAINRSKKDSNRVESAYACVTLLRHLSVIRQLRSFSNAQLFL